jgi:tRNA (guanine37-N1)-methyltransferase
MKLKHALRGVLTEEELDIFVGSYDVVGDIAIIIVPEALRAKEQKIAEVLLAGNGRIKVVAKRAGYYGGEFRTIPLTILAGEERKETEVKEFGIRLRINPETVYYSVRSGYERRRIASLVQDDEEVLVLFSGVAPYPLVISRYSRARAIIGLEKNPEAHRYALDNLRQNRKLANIELHLGDAGNLPAAVAGRYFDRVIMPLPTMAATFLPTALKVLKRTGWLHFYDLQSPEFFESSVQKIADACLSRSRILDSAEITRCGHCGPRTYRICIDARICQGETGLARGGLERAGKVCSR